MWLSGVTGSLFVALGLSGLLYPDCTSKWLRETLMDKQDDAETEETLLFHLYASLVMVGIGIASVVSQKGIKALFMAVTVSTAVVYIRQAGEEKQFSRWADMIFMFPVVALLRVSLISTPSSPGKLAPPVFSFIVGLGTMCV